MADLSRTVSVIFTGEDRLSPSVAEIDRRFASIGSEATEASGKIDRMGNELEGIGRRTAGVDAATRALQGLAASLVFRAFVDANLSMETFNRTMTVVTGSSAEAAREFDYVRQTSERLGLQLFSTANNYSQLSAATRGTVLEGEQTRRIFEAVSGAMGVLGRSSQDTSGALLAITQIVSRGTVSMEELGGQLGERIPGALGIAARSMGLTTQALIDLVSSGDVAAVDFLPRFAEELQRTFAADRIEGYEASLNRLKNTLDEAFITVGDAGAFDALTGALTIGTAAVTGAIAAFRLLGETIGIVFAYLSSINFNPIQLLSDATRDLVNQLFNVGPSGAQQFGGFFEEAFNRAAASTSNAGAEVLRLFGLMDRVQTAAPATGGAVRQAFSDARFEASRLGDGTEEVNTALRGLGLDPTKFTVPVDNIIAKFEELAANPATTGTQLLAGLKATLRQITEDEDVDAVARTLQDMFAAGSIKAGEMAIALDLVNKRSAEVNPTLAETAKQLKETEKSAEKAREAAEKYKLEMERLASNERIKLIEAKVQLDIANVEANARTAIAAFESINNTITDTGDALGDLFRLFGNESLSFSEQSLIRQQIDMENTRRDEALALQRRLIEAQINQIRAQTAILDRGDAIINIDGAGLQPHLEAFMFEILRAIQTRVNAQGLDLLLGMPIV